ncbi:MAG TPA: c-type cytochrome [Solirubrobacterales bacterium]|nr:c-type cytochrome [Solirubrobacterales bacterium]
MSTRSFPVIAGRARKAAVLVVAAAGLAMASGCGLGSEADTERGRALFTQHCGACHTLAEAGTSSAVGPNLDAAFTDARSSGMTDSTIADTTRNQIANPRLIRDEEPGRNQVFMPADLVTGQDAEDVSAYVGSVAGIPGIEPPDVPVEQLFVERCGACHTLAAAGTQSDVGPDLDEVLPGQDEQQVERSIVDPNAEITQGFQAGVMPENFEELLGQDQIMELVQFLLDNAGQGG